jgi:uncharacterized protein (DUF1501 family)
MHISKLESIQRREFLRRTAALGVAGTAGPLAMTLAGIGEAAAQTAPEDYKALVCIFLYGGNDHDNTFIPYDDARHGVYETLRDIGDTDTKIYIPKTSLTPLVGTGLATGQQYAVQPSLVSVGKLFNDTKKLGILLNVGTLVKPTTKSGYTNAKAGDLPPKLFSHNDQFSLWQSGLSSGAEGTTQGWGGRLGDLFLDSDNKAHFTCINASGNAVFMSGKNVLPYQVSNSGSVAVNSITFGTGPFGIAACKTALSKLLNNSAPSHWMEKEWARVMKSSIDNRLAVSKGIETTDKADYFTTAFATDNLSAQLKIVARLIQARSTLGVKRQVFFVSMGGFDLHDNLMSAVSGHNVLLRRVNDAMNSFYNATVQLGVANQVTAFTASDFGRTMASNGDGSDHGWGGHHMVMGGAVDGGKFWGKAPDISNLDNALNGPDSVGQGRLLPSTSVDEYAAALARWMGVNETDLPTVLPDLRNFESNSGRSRLPLFVAPPSSA